MNHLVRRCASVAVTLSIYTLVALTGLSLLALAQEPPPFEISVIPQAEYAIAGQPFTYTVVITNISQMPIKDVLINVKIPDGSTLIDTYFVNPNWLVGGAQRGQAGEVIWYTQEPVTPAETANFDLVVNVLPESLNRQLVNQDYLVTTLNNSGLIASGPPIRTQVLGAAPTPSPTFEATRTSTPTPQTSSGIPNGAPTTISSATQTPQPISAGTASATAIPSSENPISKTLSRFTFNTLIFGLLVLALIIIGLAWLLKKRG